MLRVVKSIRTIPERESWFWAVGLLLLYGLIYLPIGFGSQFLTLDIETSGWTIAGVIVRALIMPGMTEELFFRGLLIPHSSETVRVIDRWLWSSISLISFVLYHPFNFFAPLFSVIRSFSLVQDYWESFVPFLIFKVVQSG
jgi:predicted Abi (CAAX) family protease